MRKKSSNRRDLRSVTSRLRHLDGLKEQSAKKFELEREKLLASKSPRVEPKDNMITVMK